MENTNKCQDIKCFIGFHRYKILDELDIKKIGYDTIIGKKYVLQCINCGKIEEKFIKTQLTKDYCY